MKLTKNYLKKLITECKQEMILEQGDILSSISGAIVGSFIFWFILKPAYYNFTNKFFTKSVVKNLLNYKMKNKIFSNYIDKLKKNCLSDPQIKELIQQYKESPNNLKLKEIEKEIIKRVRNEVDFWRQPFTMS